MHAMFVLTAGKDIVKKNYEAGSPIADIAASVGRSQAAVLQRAWEKGWRRPNTDRRETSTESQSIKQNTKVTNGISSGLLFGGQVIGLEAI